MRNLRAYKLIEIGIKILKKNPGSGVWQRTIVDMTVRLDSTEKQTEQRPGEKHFKQKDQQGQGRVGTGGMNLNKQKE